MQIPTNFSRYQTFIIIINDEVIMHLGPIWDNNKKRSSKTTEEEVAV